jgi:hypothetical protein
MLYAWFKSRRVSWVMAVTAGLLACIYWSGALPSTHHAHGPAPLDLVIGRWACVESFGPFEPAQIDVRLKFGPDHSLMVEMAAKNSLSTSVEGTLAGQGTWRPRTDHEILLTVENLRYGFDEPGAVKRAKRVRRWCNKRVHLTDVGDRQLILADLFRSGQEVFYAFTGLAAGALRRSCGSPEECFPVPVTASRRGFAA